MFDLTKFPSELKNLLSNSIMLPFWYISIYIFSPSLYNSKDYLLIGSICVTLTIIASIITSSMVVGMSKTNEKILDTNITFLSIFFQIITISPLIFICYIYSVLFNKILFFHYFILIYFLLLIAIHILLFLTEKNTRNIKNENTTEK